MHMYIVMIRLHALAMEKLDRNAMLRLNRIPRKTFSVYCITKHTRHLQHWISGKKVQATWTKFIYTHKRSYLRKAKPPDYCFLSAAMNRTNKIRKNNQFKQKNIRRMRRKI